MPPTRRTRLLSTLAVTLVLVVGATVAIRALWPSVRTQLTVDSCTAGGFDVDPGEAAVASTMVGAVTQHAALRTAATRQRAAVLVIAAALQESKLSNIAAGAGDRDSVGVLQQRPSQGWGARTGADDSIAARTRRLTDVGEATREFLVALLKVPGWAALPAATAIQTVQRSADGSLYAQHEPLAQALSTALLGTSAAAITCSFTKPTAVASAAEVAAQAAHQLGISTPVASGRQVRVPGAHWQTASWFVANADRLGIDQVEYAGRRWTRAAGWRAVPAVPSTAVVATVAG